MSTFDATDAEIERRQHLAEMGEDSASERDWSRYAKGCGAIVRRRGWITPGYPETMGCDGDEEADGFSLDGAYEAWERRDPLGLWEQRAAEKRAKLGLSV